MDGLMSSSILMRPENRQSFSLLASYSSGDLDGVAELGVVLQHGLEFYPVVSARQVDFDSIGEGFDRFRCLVLRLHLLHRLCRPFRGTTFIREYLKSLTRSMVRIPLLVSTPEWYSTCWCLVWEKTSASCLSWPVWLQGFPPCDLVDRVLSSLLVVWSTDLLDSQPSRDPLDRTHSRFFSLKDQPIIYRILWLNNSDCF